MSVSTKLLNNPPLVTVASAGREDLEGIASCHEAAFPGEFLTLLGSGFLRTFYRFYIDDPDGICMMAIDRKNKRVVGLVAGGKPELRAAFMRRHILRFISTSFCKFFIHCRVRHRLAEHFVGLLRKIVRKIHLVPQEKYPPAPEDPSGTWSNLLSVCTHPDYRGCGVGKMLMEAFRIESSRRGYRTMRLSVHNDNDAAIAMYKKSGWTPVLTIPSGTYFKRPVGNEQ